MNVFPLFGEQVAKHCVITRTYFSFASEELHASGFTLIAGLSLNGVASEISERNHVYEYIFNDEQCYGVYIIPELVFFLGGVVGGDLGVAVLNAALGMARLLLCSGVRCVILSIFALKL